MDAYFLVSSLQIRFYCSEIGSKKKADERTDGRMHRIWPDPEALGSTPRTPKSLPVTARSSQKEIHKCISPLIEHLRHSFSANLLCIGFGLFSKKRLRRKKLELAFRNQLAQTNGVLFRRPRGTSENRIALANRRLTLIF